METTGVLVFAVGSTNKAKVKAVEMALEKVFPKATRSVVAVKAVSGVRDQPLSDKESIEGATARAKQALKEANADYGIGLEGGIDKLGDTWFQCGWCVVVDRNGKTGVGSSARYELSQVIVEPLLNEGKELAEVMDAITGLHDVRSDQGAMGILTNGLLPRAHCYQHGIIFAFAPFISNKKFWSKDS